MRMIQGACGEFDMMDFASLKRFLTALFEMVCNNAHRVIEFIERTYP